MKNQPVCQSLLFLTVSVMACSSVMAQSPSGMTSFEYDALGNLTVERNALLHTAKHSYDALSRLTTTFDAYEKKIQLDRDLRDQLVKVVDARNVATGYVVDGLGKLTKTSSADTGVTETVYDEAGNMISSIDAKKQTTQLKYDALNRVELITSADNSTVAYLYDQTKAATGRLSKITDSSGSTSYDYDAFGNVISETRIIDNKTYAITYRYDEFGRLAGLTYPSGRKIDYQYDPHGRIIRINTEKGGVIKPVIIDVSYQPFGGVNKITFANGTSQTRAYDLDGRMESYTLRNKTIALGYDAGNRLKTVSDAAAPATGTSYNYDKMDRLAGMITPTMSQVFTYDDVGNRTSRQINGTVKTLTYAPTSNRLTAVGTQAIAIDDNGSITNRGDGTFKYDVRGRLISFEGVAGLVRYTVNSLGQRVSKTTPAGTTVFYYDLGGKLIGETTSEGAIAKTQEYVYLGDIPVAVMK